MLNNKKGQSTVEYIVLVTAVVLVMILFLVGDQSPFKSKLTGTVGTVSDGMEALATRIDSTHVSPEKPSPNPVTKTDVNVLIAEKLPVARGVK